MTPDNLDRDKGGPISIHGDVQSSVLITGSRNIVLLAARQAQEQGRDPTRMLRVVALLAAPVHNPEHPDDCLLYTSPSPRDRQKSRMPSSA